MKKGKNYLFRFLSIMFICIFCAVTLCGCLGGGGSSSGGSSSGSTSGSGGSSGGSSSSGSGGSGSGSGSEDEDDKLKNPFASDGRYVKNYNDVLLGVVGVYDIDNTAKVFYDPYTASSSDNEDAIVNFDFLIDRQFNALSSIICQSLELYYAENGGPSCISVNDYMPDGATLEASVDDYFDTYNVFQYTSKEHIASLNYQKAKEGGFPMICDEYKFLDEENSVQAEDDEGNLLYESDGSPVWETKVYNYEYYYYYDIDGYSPSVDAGWEEKNTIDASSFLTEWKNKDISVEKMARQLKTIYIECYSNENSNYASESIGDRVDLDFNNSSLASLYSGGSIGETSNNDDISTLGFTKEFMWHTLYYLAYNVIGEDHIKASTDYRNIVFSGGDVRSTRENDVFIEESSDNSPLNHDDIARNLAIFQNYKGYDYILLEIINKAFMAIKDDTDTLANSETANYCFDKRVDGIQIDYNQSLFPFLERNEYIFYDSVEEICDAEGEGKTQGDSSKYENMDWDNYDPETIDPTEGREEGEKKKEKAFKVGTKRKLKQLIFLPKINKMKYNYETFEISTFMFGFIAESATGDISSQSNDELDSKNTVSSVNISIKINLDMVGVKCDDKDKIIENPYYLEDDEKYFSFDGGEENKELTMPNGDKIDVSETPEGLDKYANTNVREMINDEGCYVVNNRNLVSDFLVTGSLFNEAKKSKEFQFGDLDTFDIAKQAFGFRYSTTDTFDVTEQKYTVASTNEEITINRLNICNQFVKTTLLDEETGFAKKSTAYNMNENYIRMLFEYFDYNGSANLSEIPEMYLMEFIMA